MGGVRASAVREFMVEVIAVGQPLGFGQQPLMVVERGKGLA